MSKTLKDKIALITGASKGIGAEVAKAYAAEGAQVIIVAKSLEGLEKTDDEIQAVGGKPATIVQLDLRDSAKIDQLALQISERFGKLDILVGNAGILGDLRPVAHYTDKIWHEVMQINITANLQLIRVFEPLLNQSDAGRAIFVTSGATKSLKPFWGAYNASKAALDALIKTWSAEHESTNLRINLLDPGIINTAMRRKAMPGEEPEKNPSAQSVMPMFLKLASPDLEENGQIFNG